MGFKDGLKTLLNTVESAFKQLHKKGSYTPEDLNQVPEFKKLIKETSSIFNTSITGDHLREQMIESLEKDIFVFSALKTHAQLFEASRLLLTKDKKIKSFEIFSNDVSKIKKNYNENYLEAEHDFAIGNVQMIDKWESFKEGDKYYLQYRTVNDGKERASHAALHNTTLPKSDSFWILYSPKNGWRCRCTIAQVLAYLNTKSNSEKALKNGDKATTLIGKNDENKLEIFRFNPAKEKVIFPPNHPYKKVIGANKVQKIVKYEGK